MVKINEGERVFENNKSKFMDIQHSGNQKGLLGWAAKI